jgi:hypothetical protein
MMTEFLDSIYSSVLENMQSKTCFGGTNPWSTAAGRAKVLGITEVISIISETGTKLLGLLLELLPIPLAT